jgi:hypothetical protein
MGTTRWFWSLSWSLVRTEDVAACQIEILTASKQYYAAFQSVRSISKSCAVTARIGAADTNATLRRNHFVRIRRVSFRSTNA